MADHGRNDSGGGGAPPGSLPGAADAAAREGDSVATVAELRMEVMALRRELRLLRIANSELERVAVRDTLTPLFNRRYFLTALHERLVRAKRYNTRAAVLFIDVNRMKYINDAFGHSAGDFALVHIAQLIQANIRTTDVAARFGGDEFAVILEEVEEDRALAKAQQLDMVLRTTSCMFGDVALPASASIGFTMLLPNDTEDALIERADTDMYARKRAWYDDSAKTSAAALAGKGSAAA